MKRDEMLGIMPNPREITAIICTVIIDHKCIPISLLSRSLPFSSSSVPSGRYPECQSDAKHQARESRSPMNKANGNESTTPREVIIKLLEIKGKENLKSSLRKKEVLHRYNSQACQSLLNGNNRR